MPRAALPLGMLVLATLALLPAFVAMERNWREITDYQHGYLVVLFVLGWCLAKAPALARVEFEPLPLAQVPLLLVLVLCAACINANISLAMEMLWPLALWLTLLATFGWPTARLLLAPLAFLYLAIPVWELIVPLLQWLTTQVVVVVLGSIGVPVQVAGTTVTIPAGTFSISEGCAGKRYLIVMLAFAVMFGVTHRLSAKQTAALIALGVVLALVMNWLRVAVIIYAGHATDMQHYLVAREHATFGWILFALVLLPLGWYAMRLSPRTKPERDSSNERAEMTGPDLPRISIAMIVPLALVLGSAALTMRSSAGAQASLQPFPLLTQSWQGPMIEDGVWRPDFAGADETRRAAYFGEGARVQVYANVYASQRPEKELVHYRNSMTGGSDATPVRRSVLRAQPTLVMGTGNDGQQWVVGYVYRVGGLVTGNGLLAQLYYGLWAIVADVPSGVLAFAMQCGADCTRASVTLESFWKETGLQFLSVVPERITVGANER